MEARSCTPVAARDPLAPAAPLSAEPATAARPVPATPEGSSRSRWTALLILCLGQLMIILDATIVNVALPAIQDDLGFTASSLAWTVNAYLIAFGSFLMLSGRLGDLFGRKRVSLIGLVVFTLASALCGAASSPAMLVGARFLQGIGGAMASASVLAMRVTLFPGRQERAQAMGVYSFVGIAGGSIGLLLGGVLTESLSWHWIFFVNVPVGIVAITTGAIFIREQAGRREEGGLDVAGAVLMTSALMLAVFTIVEAESAGWVSLRTLGCGAISIALLVAFVLLEGRLTRPLIPLSALRSQALAGSCAIVALLMVAVVGWFFFGSLYLVDVLGYGAAKTGAAFVPATLCIGGLSLSVTARLMHRFGAYAVMVAGLVMIIIGLVLFSRVPVHGTYVHDVLPGMLVMGIGAGLTFMPVFTTAMSTAGRRDSGVASGLLNTAQQVGGALGLAVLASLSASRTASLLAGGEDPDEALTAGYHLASMVGIGTAATAIVLATVLLRRHAGRGAAMGDHGHHGHL